MEFVGIDFSEDGNCTAMSNHQLLRTWPSPTTVHDVTSLIDFEMFHSSFIPHFEVHVKRHWSILNLPPHFNNAAKAEWEDIKSAMLLGHCMIRFDHSKHIYLRTDFSAISFGYAATQPIANEESITGIRCGMAGGLCKFMAKDSKLSLCPVAFSS